jgi:phage tail-like protein
VDVNGQRFWQLAAARDWQRDGEPPLAYDAVRRVLTLGSVDTRSHVEDEAEAVARLARPSIAVDGLDTFAYYAPGPRAVLAAGAAPGAVVIRELAAGEVLTDIAVGSDDALYLAIDGAVVMHDLRHRAAGGGLGAADERYGWAPVRLTLAGFQAFRIAPDSAGGAWVLDRANRRLGRVDGLPYPRSLLAPAAGDVFRPVAENPREPALTAWGAPVGEELVAIASSPRGEAAVLAWLPDGTAAVRSLDRGRGLGPRIALVGAQRPYSLAWIGARTIAVLVATAAGAVAIAYQLPADDAARAYPQGGIYPMPLHDGGPLARTLGDGARYGSTEVGAPDAVARPPRPLVALSAPRLARRGSARGAAPFDSGRPGFTWHRLYVEAALPVGCAIRLRVAASDERRPPPADAYALHVVGDGAAGAPRAAWCTVPSELPFHEGLLGCPTEPDRAGLFTVLIQRTGRRVSTVQGRFLWVEVELVGSGATAPSLAAVRAYGSRFSYAERYLPSLYREQVFAPEADEEAAQPTPADFLDRFLLNFEGVLTVLEDRIGNAHLLTDPDAAPAEALEWLGQWVGVSFGAAYPAARRRRRIKRAVELQRWRGTMRGVKLALDIATDGAIERGELVVVEEYRLRRTFATILGADLADEHDPLLAGIVDSGNSIVGDTLFLGEEWRREFVAVFRESVPDLPRGGSWQDWQQYAYEAFVDPAAVDRFFDRLANRVTVLVHPELDAAGIGLVQRVLDEETPSHVIARVARATHPFIVGLASLVGVDTFLRRRPPPPSARLDETRIGERAFLRRPASLDPRLEGGSE